VSDKQGQGNGGAEAGPVQVHWDDSEMRTTYANVCNVTGTREEFSLLFGTNRTWQTGSRRFDVKLSDRVVLSPFAAKRLCLLLQNALAQYEARFGALNVQPDAGTSGELASTPRN